LEPQGQSKWLRLWRYWFVLALGLALFVLAYLQATDPVRLSTRGLYVGVATKVVTGIMAIMVIRVVQDCMDDLASARKEVSELKKQLGHTHDPPPQGPGPA
jgi:hypothetical protein